MLGYIDVWYSYILFTDDDSLLHECVDKHADFHITCPTSDIWNETTAFDPNMSMSCQTITTDISAKLNKQFRQCNDIGMCMFSPADLFGDHKCSSKGKYLNLIYTCKGKHSNDKTTYQGFNISSILHPITDMWYDWKPVLGIGFESSDFVHSKNGK